MGKNHSRVSGDGCSDLTRVHVALMKFIKKTSKILLICFRLNWTTPMEARDSIKQPQCSKSNSVFLKKVTKEFL